MKTAEEKAQKKPLTEIKPGDRVLMTLPYWRRTGTTLPDGSQWATVLSVFPWPDGLRMIKARFPSGHVHFAAYSPTKQMTTLVAEECEA